MRKNFAAGLIVAGLIVTGGTGYFFGNAGDNSQVQPQTIRTSQVTPMMDTGNMQGLQPLVQNQNLAQNQNKGQSSTFDQMLPYMKQMHPNLSDDQLKALYEQMMGPNGACSNAMGNFLNGNNQ